MKPIESTESFVQSQRDSRSTPVNRRPAPPAAGPAQGVDAPEEVVAVAAEAMTAPSASRPRVRTYAVTDPMMVMLSLMHERTQMVLGELSNLAEDQKHNNDLLSRAREVDTLVRKMAAGTITSTDVEQLALFQEEFRREGYDLGFGSRTEGALGALHADLAAFGSGSNGYVLDFHTLSPENQKKFEVNLASVKEAVTDLKDNIKGAFQNKELDMQKITQEYSTAVQTQSNLSKRWSDTMNAVVGNLRA